MIGAHFLYSTRFYSRFEFLQLISKCLNGQVGCGFERTGLFLGKKLFTWNAQFDFYCFIFNPLVVDSEEDFTFHEPVIKGLQFVNALLDKIDQFAIGIEMDGMNL